MNKLMNWVALFALGCSGSSETTEPTESRADAGFADVNQEAGDATQTESARPATGVAACMVWENGPKPQSAVDACRSQLGEDAVDCAEATRHNWQASCEGDCETMDVDQTWCVCDCMVRAVPWDGDAGDNCPIDYLQLYECWVSNE